MGYLAMDVLFTDYFDFGQLRLGTIIEIPALEHVYVLGYNKVTQNHFSYQEMLLPAGECNQAGM